MPDPCANSNPSPDAVAPTREYLTDRPSRAATASPTATILLRSVDAFVLRAPNALVTSLGVRLPAARRRTVANRARVATAESQAA